jgi:hypothetical protein
LEIQPYFSIILLTGEVIFSKDVIEKEITMKKSAIIISVLITAFVLGTVGAVVKAVSDTQTNAKVQELEQTIQTREDLYAQTIADANARLAQANQIIQGKAVAVPTPSIIGPDQAIKNAIAAVGSFGMTVTNPPELVNYNGTTAYEVKSSEGTQVYIDSKSGALLYNSLTGTSASVISDKDAIQAASTYMPGYTFASITRSVYNGQQVYVVAFTSGDQVYVNLAGQVVYLVQMQYQTASTGSYAGGGGSSSSGGGGESDHEGGEGGGD